MIHSAPTFDRDDPLAVALKSATAYKPIAENRVWAVRIGDAMVDECGEFRVATGDSTPPFVGRAGDYLIGPAPLGAVDAPAVAPLVAAAASVGTGTGTGDPDAPARAAHAAAELGARVVTAATFARSYTILDATRHIATRKGRVRAVTWNGPAEIIRSDGQDVAVRPGNTLVIGGDAGEMWIAAGDELSGYTPAGSPFSSADNVIPTYLFSGAPLYAPPRDARFHVISDRDPISALGHLLMIVNPGGPAGHTNGIAELASGEAAGYEPEFILLRAIAMLYAARIGAVPILTANDSGPRRLNPQQVIPSQHTHIMLVDAERYAAWGFDARRFAALERERRVPRDEAAQWLSVQGASLEEVLDFATAHHPERARRCNDSFASRAATAAAINDSAACTVQVGDRNVYVVDPAGPEQGIFNMFLADVIAIPARAQEAVFQDEALGGRLNLRRLDDLGTWYPFQEFLQMPAASSGGGLTVQGMLLRQVLDDPAVSAARAELSRRGCAGPALARLMTKAHRALCDPGRERREAGIAEGDLAVARLARHDRMARAALAASTARSAQKPSRWDPVQAGL